MSFILDALRKAERDRNLGQAPRIEDVALAQEHALAAPAGGPRRALRIVGLGLLALIAVLLVVLLLRKPAQRPPAAAAPQGVVNATIRGPAPVDAPAAAEPAAETQIDDAPPALAADEQLLSLDDLSQTPAATAPAEPKPETAVREQDFIARPAPAFEAAPAPQPAPAAEAEQPARLSSLTAAVGAGATPLSDMPPAYRADFPELTVEVHAWDSNPARRFVLIGGRRYGEGETLAQGPRLAEIAQDGLILEFRGSRVLYSLQ